MRHPSDSYTDGTTQLKVLHQLTQWIMLHPERIRDKMEEQKPSDQTDWRIEPYGWDSEDREYYLLDDDRLYRRTEAPPAVAAWEPKKNTKKAKAAARAAKRRRVSRAAAADADDGEDAPAPDDDGDAVPEDDSFGGAVWECIAVTLDEVHTFLGTIRKSRDENEKILRDRIEEGLVPILEKQEESRKRKALAREKELLNLQKMANAKRSSRLAGKAERLKQEEETRKEEEKHRREEAVARKEEQLRIKRENERDNRLMSREKRLKEREVRRLQYQEELAQLSEDSKNVSEDGVGRLSERRLQAEIAKNKRALEELEEEEDWIFDCVCGVYGQVDDGTHSISCERCSVWQHSKCVSVSEEEADREDFHFICNTCKQKEANPKPVIKLKVKNADETSSPAPATDETETSQHRTESRQPELAAGPPSKPVLQPGSSSFANGTGAGDRGRPLTGSHPLHSSPPQAPSQPTIPVKPTSQASILPPPSPYANGETSNPFSSPHPTLSPPQQSPNKSRAYSTINQSSPPAARLQLGEHKILPPKGIFHVSPRTSGTSQAEKPASDTPPAEASAPPAASRIESPVKQSTENPAGNPPGMSSPSTSFSTQGRPSSSGTPSVLTTPQFKHTQPAGTDIKTPTLPPSLPPTQNGISPLKRSPPSTRPSSNGSLSTPAPAILPPVAALSPTPSQQISTPPIKPAEPVRPASQQSNSAFGKS